MKYHTEISVSINNSPPVRCRGTNQKTVQKWMDQLSISLKHRTATILIKSDKIKDDYASTQILSKNHHKI